MKTLITFLFITTSGLLFAQDDDLSDEASLTPSPSSASRASSPVPQLTPEQAKIILEKVKQGEKLQRDQQKALEELDEE
jgi:hypothetical protein